MANPDALCKTGYSQEQCGTCARNVPRDYRNASVGPFDDWYRIGTFCIKVITRHRLLRVALSPPPAGCAL